MANLVALVGQSELPVAVLFSKNNRIQMICSDENCGLRRTVEDVEFNDSNYPPTCECGSELVVM